ncbi:MAG TPA: hypothetical protein VKF59_04865 [Candidatus Dormibacteraeota bacterium]|nr:hypothetical protein [Candidatus Dormibacteraeota bacterium]
MSGAGANRRRARSSPALPAGRTVAPPTSPTPVPPPEMAAVAAELRDLVGTLVALTGSANAWGVRALRRNLELAHRCPATLERAENQLDFIEELREAVWDTADPGLRHGLPAGRTEAEAQASAARRRAIVERLDHLVADLCRAVEDWRPPAPADEAEDVPRDVGRRPNSPG